MLKLSDLALRPDLQLGPMLVSPSRRLVEGPGGHVHLEPLIMQVFLLLLDAGGKVVTRSELFDRCWGGVIVGDDSLNRAIAKVRRIGGQVAPGLFEIETIPRTGYRLTGQILDFLNAPAAAAGKPVREDRISRRMLIGGTAAVTVAGAAGLWWIANEPRGPTFDALMARGDEAFRSGEAFASFGIGSGANPQLERLYEQAVALEPGNARAWGLLAYFRSLRADDSKADQSAELVAKAQEAIGRALDIDPREPNARVARYVLQGRMLDWIERDRQLRSILATDPRNLLAMMELMPLLQAAGLTRESWMWNERILAASPLARPCLVVRAMKLWILGRVRESDNVIDRVRGLWPDYLFGFFVRFILFALTDRPQAARAMLESSPDKFGKADELAMWRTALHALETRSAAAIEAARQACFQVARTVPRQVNDAVMLLGALGLTDAAFEVVEGFLLWRGRIVSTGQANGKEMDDYSRRMTQWLFTPPLKAMRADPRFARLCDELGLTAYWRARGVKPDYQVYG
jgi:DNA-binding winged helix-turn-helix (wHTH) protein